MLGGTVRPGSLRAYTIRKGFFGLDSNRRLAWLDPRVQMLFQVTGSEDKTAMVSMEALRHRTHLNFTLIAVDVLDTPTGSQLVVVAGDEDRLHVRGQLRAFLQSERVQYIEQTKEPDDLIA